MVKRTRFEGERLFDVEDWRHFLFALILVAVVVVTMIVTDYVGDCDRPPPPRDTTWTGGP